MLTNCLANQKKAFLSSPFPTLKQRKEALKKLRHQISRYQSAFADAASADFGGRPEFESRLIETTGTIWILDHALKSVHKWMKPKSRSPQALFAGPNSLKVTYQPKGVVGIVTPWNMPLYLSLGPLVTALAAGNRAMIKLPDETPESNKVIKQLLAEIFDETEVAVFGEEITNPADFSSLAFDHLIFTGSPRVGRLVMAAAAKNLTPVTLELGGKSPSIVADDYSVADAALRIVHGKIAISGQVCVAPDYAFVPRNKVDQFTKEAIKVFNRFYPNGVINQPDYAGIINEQHLNRLTNMLNDAKEKGAVITAAAPWDGGLKIPMHIVSNVSKDMTIAQEEVFGPFLPVIAYDDIEEVFQYIANDEKPLACYLFSNNSGLQDRVIKNVHSGGLTINDWGWHVVNAEVPFGGVGNSGFGTYHGVEGFRELSNERAVFHRNRFFPTELFHPPVYQGWRGIIHKVTMNFYVGKGDPSIVRPLMNKPKE